MDDVLLGFMDAMEYAFDRTMQQALASAATKVKVSAVTLTLLSPLLTPAEPLLSNASHLRCHPNTIGFFEFCALFTPCLSRDGDRCDS